MPIPIQNVYHFAPDPLAGLRDTADPKLVALVDAGFAASGHQQVIGYSARNALAEIRAAAQFGGIVWSRDAALAAIAVSWTGRSEDQDTLTAEFTAVFLDEHGMDEEMAAQGGLYAALAVMGGHGWDRAVDLVLVRTKWADRPAAATTDPCPWLDPFSNWITDDRGYHGCDD